MLNEKDIRQALDRRLSGLDASGERRMRIRRAVNQERQEAQNVKSRKTMLVAIALAAVMLTSAIAVAETLNLFDFFGKDDARYAALAPKATLEIADAVLVEHPRLGQVEAKIDSAYFDGLTLTLAYRVSQTAFAEGYTPTAEELSAMGQEGAATLVDAGDDASRTVIAAYEAAVEAGQPYGYRMYSVFAGDATVTDDGMDIEPESAQSDTVDGAYCEIVNYAVPLAQALRDRDALTVTKELFQQQITVWFDGEQHWASYETQFIGTLTAVIPKTPDQVKAFAGSGEINGANCTFTAEVSPMAAVLTLKSNTDFAAFLTAPADAEDTWGEMCLFDQDGKAYQAQGGFLLNADRTVTLVFDGTGELPTGLTAYAYGWGETDQGLDLTAMDGVTLTEK